MYLQCSKHIAILDKIHKDKNKTQPSSKAKNKNKKKPIHLHGPEIKQKCKVIRSPRATSLLVLGLQSKVDMANSLLPLGV